jgi:deoxyribodipyrimidine photolyase-related protein
VSVFASRLAALQSNTPVPARHVFVAPDQLSDRLGPLSRTAPTELGIVVVESPRKARLRPYHRQKLALVLTNLRHFALEQAALGRHVVHLVAADRNGDGDAGGDYASVLRPFARAHGPLLAMTPAERELRQDLQPLVDEGLLELVSHEGWLSTAADFTAAGPAGGPWRMDAFYRAIRRRTGILMDARGKPEGGQFSFDGDNRKPWKGTPPAPTPPRFVVDDITAEVVQLVETRFADHPGTLDAGALPATAADATTLWAWAKAQCLPHFGPYEDAMSTRSRGLFHSRVSALMNLHRLLPKDIVDDVVALELPLASKEGFIRQVIGWREFVKRVHDASDGFRVGRAALVDGAAAGAPSFLGARDPLPPAFWPKDGVDPWRGAESGLRCLDHVVGDVWARGLQPPHHAPHGARQHRRAPRRLAARAHRLVLGGLRRRLRLGRRAQRARHGHLRRRRRHDDEALRRRQRLRRQDERLLPRLRVLRRRSPSPRGAAPSRRSIGTSSVVTSRSCGTSSASRCPSPRCASGAPSSTPPTSASTGSPGAPCRRASGSPPRPLPKVDVAAAGDREQSVDAVGR